MPASHPVAPTEYLFVEAEPPGRVDTDRRSPLLNLCLLWASHPVAPTEYLFVEGEPPGPRTKSVFVEGEPPARPYRHYDRCGMPAARPNEIDVCCAAPMPGRSGALVFPGIGLDLLNDVEMRSSRVRHVGKMSGAGRFRLGNDDRRA